MKDVKIGFKKMVRVPLLIFSTAKKKLKTDLAIDKIVYSYKEV